MSKWIGYAVSANCGETLGCYQGTILEADGTTITLTKAFRNGFPYPKSQVTLNAADIKDLKIIEAPSDPAGQTHSTVSVSKAPKKSHRATVCETLQANPSSSGNQQSGSGAGGRGGGPGMGGGGGGGGPGNAPTSGGPARSKPIDIQGGGQQRSQKNTGSYGHSGSTPKARGGCGAGSAGRRGGGARLDAWGGDTPEGEFDFEGNLALFDKQALWEHIRNSHKPDLVRHADEAGALPGKLRHDESVLPPAPRAAPRCVRAPRGLRAGGYAADDAAVLPALLQAERARMWQHMDSLGFGEGAQALLARAACDVALRLVGGARRLAATNHHQHPLVVAVVSPTAPPVALITARLLESHGSHAACLVLPGQTTDAVRRHAAQLQALATPRPRPDLILLQLHEDPPADVAAWLCDTRACVVLVEPGTAPPPAAAPRAAVCALLPPPATLLGGARLYLANVAPPMEIFRARDITYSSPFGTNSVIPLYPTDD